MFLGILEGKFKETNSSGGGRGGIQKYVDQRPPEVYKISDIDFYQRVLTSENATYGHFDICGAINISDG